MDNQAEIKRAVDACASITGYLRAVLVAIGLVAAALAASKNGLYASFPLEDRRAIKGAKPADLRMEQPTKFELVMHAAKQCVRDPIASQGGNES